MRLVGMRARAAAVKGAGRPGSRRAKAPLVHAVRVFERLMGHEVMRPACPAVKAENLDGEELPLEQVDCPRCVATTRVLKKES